MVFTVVLNEAGRGATLFIAHAALAVWTQVPRAFRCGNQRVFALMRHDSRHCRVHGGQGFHVALDCLFLLEAHLAQVVIGLQAGPHLRAGAEVTRQPQGGG